MPNASDLRGFDVAQAFQPATHLLEKSAGWKACPTLGNQDRTLKSQALGFSPTRNDSETPQRFGESLLQLKGGACTRRSCGQLFS